MREASFSASVWKGLASILRQSDSKTGGVRMTIPSTAQISEADYCAIEDALQSSEKGRRFLRAYVDRHRGLETLRLLRSISRLHRAALGAPGFQAEVARDLSDTLRDVAKLRQSSSECADDAIRASFLVSGVEDIESRLIALIESLEEKSGESTDDEMSVSRAPSAGEGGDRNAKLFGELASYFSTETR
jgi:hypothetical protein